MEQQLDMPLRDVLTLMQDRIVQRTSYLGVGALKNPLDYWVYQELIHEIRPDVIVEIGVRFGGAMLSLAHLCDLVGHGRLIGVDVSLAQVAPRTREHPRVTLFEGDACEMAERVKELCGSDDVVLVIEDSSHTYENTLNVLRTYSPLVKPGGYFIVEDGICHHGLDVGPNPGPYEAIETFLAENTDFFSDREREAFLITWNPKGFLKRRGVLPSRQKERPSNSSDALVSAAPARKLYIELMKKCLANTIYRDQGIRGKKPREFDGQIRAEGKDWPVVAHTMVGTKRLDNLQFCVEDVIARGVPGDLIETGVWRGGAVILMRAILKAYGISDRSVWVADSFQGLPQPDPESYPDDAGDKHHAIEELAISLEQVRENFERYDLLDQQVRFLEGWFRDTLPVAPIDQLSVLRLDGDMYESTMIALQHLYPKLAVGGYLIVDDYGAVPACKKAVTDYRTAQGIEVEFQWVDWTGIYWKKTRD